MSKGHKMPNDQDRYFDHRITKLEAVNENINQTLSRFENKIDDLKRDVDKRFDNIDSKFNDINNRLWKNFYWMIAGFIGVLGVIARSSHWI